MLKWLQRFKRPPDFLIGPPENVYMCRWYCLPRNDWFNIYLHKIIRDDDDRALHDHPWVSLSLILSGGYWELRPDSARKYRAGSVIYRGAEYAHRLEILDDKPCWTLFITGPKLRVWGFHCPKGWIPWTEFCDVTDHGNVGRGCGESD